MKFGIHQVTYKFVCERSGGGNLLSVHLIRQTPYSNCGKKLMKVVQVSLAAVNHIYAPHEFMNGCKNIKKIIKY